VSRLFRRRGGDGENIAQKPHSLSSWSLLQLLLLWAAACWNEAAFCSVLCSALAVWASLFVWRTRADEEAEKARVDGAATPDLRLNQVVDRPELVVAALLSPLDHIAHRCKDHIGRRTVDRRHRFVSFRFVPSFPIAAAELELV
jgi:hypothetical protein